MHCITCALQLYFHAFSCVLYMLSCLCAGRFGLGWAHDAFYFACHMLMQFHAYIPYIQYNSIYLNCLELFWLSLFPPLSLVYVNVLMAPKRKSASSQNPLHSRAFTSSSDPTPSSIRFMMRIPKRTSQRTFLDEVFIRNVESFWQTSPTLTYSMSFTVEVGSHCVTSQSHVLPCWSKSFTPTYKELILQYLSFILAFEVHAVLSHRSWYPMCFVSRG